MWWPTDGNKGINYVCCGHYEPDDHDMTHLEDGVVGNACQQRQSGAGVEDDATAAISAYVKKSAGMSNNTSPTLIPVTFT